MDATADILTEIFHRLLRAFGPQHWWPAEDRLEVMVGAVLTQNTSWKGVEQALANLRAAGLLDIAKLHTATSEHLATLIRPCGYFNVKARRLKNLLEFIHRTYGGSIARMAAAPTELLRKQLLAVSGIGPETADSILLYALERPVFVIDAYTRRILGRHHLMDPTAPYEQVQQFFTGHLQPEVYLFNEYHALLVRLGKEYCRPRPRCSRCPLEPLVP